MQNEKRERWRESHLLTPERKELARHVLDLIRRGQDVTKTLRRHPLEDGSGYLNKAMLVSIYNEMVDDGEIKEDPAPARTDSDETHAHPIRRDDCYGSDQTLSLPR